LGSKQAQRGKARVGKSPRRANAASNLAPVQHQHHRLACPLLVCLHLQARVAAFASTAAVSPGVRAGPVALDVRCGPLDPVRGFAPARRVSPPRNADASPGFISSGPYLCFVRRACAPLPGRSALLCLRHISQLLPNRTAIPLCSHSAMTERHAAPAPSTPFADPPSSRTLPTNVAVAPILLPPALLVTPTVQPHW
jgi:hypothetical protein